MILHSRSRTQPRTRLELGGAPRVINQSRACGYHEVLAMQFDHTREIT